MPNTYDGANAALSALISAGPLSLGLFTDAPTVSGGGTEISDSGTGYARQAIAFDAPANGTTANSARIDFPQALVSWGTITSWAIFDNAGVMKRYGAFLNAKVIDTGDFVSVAAGAFTLSEYGTD